jgi:hypothetical protein
MGAIARPLLVATNIKGRRHAYRGIVISDEVRVPKRAVRSVCGVPCKATSEVWRVDNEPETCKRCVEITTGGSE